MTLWLPLEAPALAWIAAALVGLVYLLTMCRDLWFYDSAEFAIVAVQGGLSHPPGHPLHTILGFLLTHIPHIPPLLGLNALSAIPAALTVIPVVSLAESLSGPSSDDEPRWLRRRAVLPTTVALLALHPSLWENATRIEVYALASFLATWSAASLSSALLDSPGRSLPWLASGFALGLSASANPVVAGTVAFAAAPAFVLALARRRIGGRAALRVVAGGLLGLLPYLYILAVGEREDVMVWGAPLRGELLRRYLTGADFEQNLGITWSMVAGNLLELLGWAATAGLLPLLALGLTAQVIWGKSAGLGRGFAAICLGGTVYFLSMNVVFYPEVSDYQGYLMTPLWLLTAGVAALLARLAAWKPRGRVLAPLLGLALIVSLSLAPPPLFGRTRHRDHVARLLAEGALERAPGDAIILASSDHWVFPLMYLQEVEGMRPDVVVLARGLSGASWHWDRIYRRHPDLERFSLRGPGGQQARIRRFFAANPARPVLYESWSEAEGIGQPGCAGSWMLSDQSACPADPAEDVPIPDELTPALEAASAELGLGAPTTDRVIAAVSLARGEDLWRLGRPVDALRAFRAGIPPDFRPELGETRVDAVPPLAGPPRRWRDERAIGHFSRNLFMAGYLLHAAGAAADARAHAMIAAEHGLPEAQP
jgi:hypothetical protein